MPKKTIKKAINKTKSKAVTTTMDAPQKLDAIARLSFYLAAADGMPNEIKEAWVKLIPAMTDQDRERLANILEAKFLDAATRHIDKQFTERLSELTKDADFINETEKEFTDTTIALDSNQKMKALHVLHASYKRQVRRIKGDEANKVAGALQRHDKAEAEALIKSMEE